MRIRLIAALMTLALMASLFTGCYTYTEEIIEDDPVSTASQKVTSNKPTKPDKTSSTSSKKTTVSRKPSTGNNQGTKKDLYSYPEIERHVLYPSGWVSYYAVMPKPSEDNENSSGVIEIDPGTSPYDDYTGFNTFGDEIINSLSEIVWNNDVLFDVISGEGAPKGSATLWPYGGYMEALGAAYEYDPTNTLYKEQYQKSLRNVMAYDANRVNQKWGVPEGTYLALTCWPHGPEAEVYYDDDVWIAKEFLHAYEVGITSDGKKDVNYLTQATRMIKYICETAWETSWKGGGLLWMDPKYAGPNSPAPQKNTCINAPAADAAVDLYMITGDEAYLEHSKKIYAWVKGQLMDPKDHLMMDKFVNSEGNITTDGGKLPYNTGCMISAAAGLYEAEKKLGAADAQDYLNDALAFAEAGVKAFMGRTQYPSLSGKISWTNKISGGPWFTSYMAEGIIDLHELSEKDSDVDATPYMQAFRVSMGLACSNRAYTNGAGWFCNDLGSIKTPKEKDINVMQQSATARMLFMLANVYDK